MRSESTSGSIGSSWVADLFAEAVTTLRQDFGEYGFTGLVGACSAAILTIFLVYPGNLVMAALAPPIVAICALYTLATTCSAVHRTRENLAPDSARSLISAIAASPLWVALFSPLLVLLTAGTAAALLLERFAGGTIGSAAMLAVLLLVGWTALARTLIIPAALDPRGQSSQATALGVAIFRSGGGTIATLWAIALAPAAIIIAAAAAAGFDALSSGIAAFAFVGSMPLAGIAITLTYAAVIERMPAQPAQRRRTASAAPDLAERLGRHVR
jgi:hypothetical protein